MTFTFDDMVEAAAVRFALTAGWSFPHELHRQQARDVLEAAKVPELLNYVWQMEGKIHRTKLVLAWAVDAVEANGIPQMPEMPELEGEDDGGVGGEVT